MVRKGSPVRVRWRALQESPANPGLFLFNGLSQHTDIAAFGAVWGRYGGGSARRVGRYVASGLTRCCRRPKFEGYGARGRLLQLGGREASLLHEDTVDRGGRPDGGCGKGTNAMVSDREDNPPLFAPASVYTVAEVAATLKIGVKAVRAAIRRGHLKGHQLTENGQYRLFGTHVEEWIQRREVCPPEVPDPASATAESIDLRRRYRRRPPALALQDTRLPITPTRQAA